MGAGQRLEGTMCRGAARLMAENLFELTCAIVSGSIGYFSPNGARRVAERYLAGETRDWSERCLTLYGCDLRRMVEADVRYWNGWSEERREQVRTWVRAVSPLDTIGQT